MNLYLVRHAKARKGGKDHLRPLTGRGMREMRAIAMFLRPLRLPIQAIWHSDRVRAIRSARILARAIAFRGRIIERDDVGPDDSIAPLIRQIKKNRGDLMIVGHLPHLGKLAAKILGQRSFEEMVNFSTSSVVSLSSEDGRKWEMQWMLSPKILRALD